MSWAAAGRLHAVKSEAGGARGRGDVQGGRGMLWGIQLPSSEVERGLRSWTRHSIPWRLDAYSLLTGCVTHGMFYHLNFPSCKMGIVPPAS